MIAACPQCQSRYRIGREKIGPRGCRLRCSRCGCVFGVQAPPAPAPPPLPEPASESAPAPESHASPPRARALVVESDATTAEKLAEELARYRIATDVIADGAEGLLRVFREPPELVVLGGRLSGLSGPAFVEIVRRSPAHSGLRLVRIAALGEPAGVPEFEADATLEPSRAARELGPVLERLGFESPPAPPRAEAPAPAAPPPPDPALGAEIVAAERLARIIVSDIILYNEDKFAQAAEAGDLLGALKPEVDEGMALFRQRVPEHVRIRRDFVLEELERRAAALGSA